MIKPTATQFTGRLPRPREGQQQADDADDAGDDEAGTEKLDDYAEAADGQED